MPLLCCNEKEPVFGQSIEEMLDSKLNIQSEKKSVPIEIQQFITYLSERNAIQFKELFVNSIENKEKNKLIKKINKAGNVNLKNEHNLHLVISVFMDFLRRMPGRIISKDIYNTFPIINEENRKIIKKIKKNLKKLPEQRYATLKYLINFFSGNCENSNSLKIELDSNEIASLAPVIASVIVEIPNDYTLSSKIYRNGNIINYISENNDIDNVKNRENLIRLMILNYKKLFTKNKKKSKSYNYSNKEYIEKDYYSKSYTVNDIPSSSPTKFHLRISSKQHSSPSSPVQTTYNSFSIDDKLYKYNTISNIRNEDLSFDNNSIYSNKNNFDISNLNCKFIDNKIYLTFSIATPDAKSQHYKLEIPSSGTGMASIRNLSKSNNGSSAQLFRVTSFSDKSDESINEDPRNLEVKLNLPLFKDTYNKKSNSFLNINYPINNSNDYSKKRSIIVKPDESVITELQLFLKATRRYLYDLQSFPTGQIKELFSFSKQRYKFVKDILLDAPYINLEPIINSPLFSSNKCFVAYEGLENLSLAQKTLMDYDIFKKNNNIKEFNFQKTNDQYKMEKDLLYQKLLILKENIKTENDRHILHELNKIYNSIRENLKNQ